MSTEQELAQKILELVGGKNNIQGIAHCMTRLRLTLADTNQADQQALKALPKVLGVLEASGQLQIILGPGFVNRVAKEVNQLSADAADHSSGPSNEASPTTARPAQAPQPALPRFTKFSDLHAASRFFLRKIANIFVPLIPAIVASGMVAGLTNIAVQCGADPTGTFITILNVIGWGIFSYLGIFVGMNTAKEFSGTPALGGLAGILIINPAIATITLYGSPLVPGRGGLIGVMLVAWFMSQIEKRLHRIVPNALDMVVTPVFTLLITGFTAFYFLQPIGGFLSDGIISLFKNLLSYGGALAGFILAGTFLPVVMTGLHQGLLPVHMEFLNVQKENPLMPILSMAGAGQIGAALAIYLKTNNSALKNIIKGALPVGFLGIGEPLIFGVTLPLGRPFLSACLGAGFGGAFQAFMHTASIALGLSGLPLAFVIKPGSVIYYLVGIFIAYLAGFILTLLIGFDESKAAAIQQPFQKGGN